MSKEDLQRIAQNAPALREIVVASLPDCLLLNHWARKEGHDPERAAAQAGTLYRASQDTLRALGPTAGIRLITLEADDGLILMCRIGRAVAAAFLFDRTTPMGLVRIQARQLAEQLRKTLDLPITRDLPAPPPERTPTQDLPSVGESGAVSATPSLGGIPLPTVTPPPSRLPRQPGSNLPSSHHTSAPPPVSSDAPGFEATPVSQLLPQGMAEAAATEFQPNASFGASSVPDGRGIPPASTERQRPSEQPSQARPRAVRLLEFFRRYAPDPHASMLRLSLRTGIPLQDLEQPESLNSDQVEAIATSVRDILGQDQMSI